MSMKQIIQISIYGMGTLIALILALPALAGSDQLEKCRELYDAKKYSEAESALKQFLKQEPENAQAAYYLGLTLLEENKFNEAEQAFLRTHEGTPSRDKIQIGLARAYMGLEQLEKAQMSLDEAEKVNPDNAKVFYYRGILAAHRKDYKASAESLEKSLGLEPDNAYAHYYAGLAYNILKRPDKMVEHFQAFLKLAPEAPEAEKVRTVLRSVH